MATVVIWTCLSVMLDAHWLTCLPWKAKCSKEQLCYTNLWHLFVILFYRWLYWHQCTNWAHSSCVHTIKMHSIVLLSPAGILKYSDGAVLSKVHVYTSVWLCSPWTRYIIHLQHVSSLPYTLFSQFRDRITSVGFVHNRAPWGMGCQSPFHQFCILCITTIPKSQISLRQYHNFYSQLGVTSVAVLDYTCCKKV